MLLPFTCEESISLRHLARWELSLALSSSRPTFPVRGRGLSGALPHQPALAWSLMGLEQSVLFPWLAFVTSWCLLRSLLRP